MRNDTKDVLRFIAAGAIGAAVATPIIFLIPGTWGALLGLALYFAVMIGAFSDAR